MRYAFDTSGEQRLQEFFNKDVGNELGKANQRASFAVYALGLLSNLERKSMEPIAALAFPDPEKTSACHQRLHGFVSQAEWSDRAVRLAAARYALGAMTTKGEAVAWVIDDTGFLKQGNCSVGVQRQYTGSAGKTANCQVAVSLSITTADAHLPVDFELFIPESWANDPERRKAARIPKSLVFRTKHEIALAMIEQAARDGLPGRIVLADSFYGHSSAFRDAVHLLGFDYGLAIHATDRFQRVDRAGAPIGPPQSAKVIARSLPSEAYRQYTWREGTNKTLRSRFAFVRVQAPAPEGVEPRTEYLIVEWPNTARTPSSYFLTTLDSGTERNEIIRLIKERYRTERVYEEGKSELGLDHFEGRSYRGWHHHISVFLCCYAFLVAERCRAFPPEAEGASPLYPHTGTTSATLRELPRNDPLGDRKDPHPLATSLSNLPSTSPKDNARRRAELRNLRSLFMT